MMHGQTEIKQYFLFILLYISTPGAGNYVPHWIAYYDLDFRKSVIFLTIMDTRYHLHSPNHILPSSKNKNSVTETFYIILM